MSNLSDIMRDFKRYTSLEIGNQLIKDNKLQLVEIFEKAAVNAKGNTRFKIWQDGFHPEIIETVKFFKQKLNYIHKNPVRKGYVSEAHHWKYSSARNWRDNDDEIIKIDINPEDLW